jgi:uncharacterized membrane protein
MFQPRLALLATAIVSGSVALWSAQYAAFAANWLIMGALPIAVTWGIHRLMVLWLPPHMFVYLFVNAYAAAAVSMLAVGVGSTLVAMGMGLYATDHLLGEYLSVYLLMTFAEAFVTGMLVTLMVVWKPDWISTFSDERYLAS